MKSNEPCVVLDVDCRAMSESGSAPDVFRLKITPSLMEELDVLRKFVQKTARTFESNFAGKRFGDMEVPFDGFAAESSEGGGDESVDRRLDRLAIRLDQGGFKLIAYMRVLNIKLVSENVPSALLDEKFAALRSLIMYQKLTEAIGSAAKWAPVTNTDRKAGGMSL